MKKGLKKWQIIVIAIIAIGVIGAVAGGGSSDDDKKKEDKKEEKEKKKTEYSIGETVEADGFKITLNSVRNAENEYVQPDEGNVYFVIDMTIENLKDEETTISSIGMFKLKDAEGREQDQSIVVEVNGSLGGKVQPNEKLSGEIAYQVPAEGELYLYMQTALFDGETIKYKVR